MASDFIQMDLLAWGGIHLEQQEPEQYPFDQPEEFTDGITPDRVETIELELPKNIKDTVSISMSRGDSGNGTAAGRPAARRIRKEPAMPHTQNSAQHLTADMKHLMRP